jgi:hypothetical protein
MDVPQYWSYAEPSGIDTAAARLAMLRRWIDDLSGVVVAKDEITQAERDRIAAEQAKKSAELFKSLQKEVYNPDKGNGKK